MALAVGSTVFEVSRFTRAVSAVKSDSLATLTPPPLVSASALTGLLHALLQLVFACTLSYRTVRSSLLRLLALCFCCALRTFYGRRVRIWIEAELKAGMSEHRRKVLDSKRILLFQEMLKDINYDDMNVVQELIDGATLTGEIPVTGVLDTKLKPARIDFDELMSISDQVKQQIRSRTVS